MIRGTRAVLPLACFRVAARVRPLSSRERAAGEVAAVCATGAQTVSVVDGGGVGGAQEFTFDAVFDSSSSQADVFDEVRDAISLALDGVNCTVFAYGATGSGKTFTLFGETAGEAGEMVEGELLLSGVLPRAAALVFDAAAVRRRAEEEGGDGTYAAVAVSVLQLYREQLGDLLHERRADHGELQDARLRVRVSPPGAVEVEHLTKLPVASAAEVQVDLPLQHHLALRPVREHIGDLRVGIRHLAAAATATAQQHLARDEESAFRGRLLAHASAAVRHQGREALRHHRREPTHGLLPVAARHLHRLAVHGDAQADARLVVVEAGALALVVRHRVSRCSSSTFIPEKSGVQTGQGMLR